ncbi:hypothetical protein J2T12_003743 [Paenibacillus anaericanus]|nr:hypothetical protein [Paenibacillus anaericanus]
MRLVGADVSAENTSLLITSRGPRSRKALMRGYDVMRSN